MNETEESYRKNWQTLTGRRDVYIPEALRTTPILEPAPRQPGDEDDK